MSPLCQFENIAISLRQGKNSIDLSHGISFEIKAGEFFALVGESGSGKSITAMCALGLYPEPGGYLRSGRFIFAGQDWTNRTAKEWQQLRGSQISVIFQEPSAALNPLYTIGAQMREAWKLHDKNLVKGQQRINELCAKVGFKEQG